MKKILAIVMALAIIMLFGACGANETSTETSTTTAGLEATTSSAAADETVSEEKQLLEELLTAEWLGLGDEAYENVVGYIKNNTPDDNLYYVTLEWELDDYTLKLNNDTKTLSLVTEDGYSKMLCQNVDFPNVHSSVAEFTVIDEVSFYESYKAIEVWQFGEELYEVDLPSTESEILGTIQNEGAKVIFVRSNSTIGAITWKEGNDFQYNEIITDCAGSAKKELGSLWYVNKDGNLVHVNLLTKEMQIVAKNVTSLVDIHDGTYSVGWREKGSLEWHEPEFCISENGEKTPWSERGGM